MHPLRVRYQETDQMAVVFHANYVNWFEIGRTELVRHLGMPYGEIEKRGLLLPVVDLTCKYILPARYDDRIIVCTSVQQYSTVRIAFRSEVRRIADDEIIPAEWNGAEPPGELLVKGGTRHVWVSTDWRPKRLDKALPELYDIIQKVAGGDEKGDC
nr:thioesterase family protein [Paenibacillus oenotherae]